MPLEPITQYEIKTIDFLILSVLVLFLGTFLTKRIRFLADNYIPPAVTGGLLFSIVVALIYALGNLQISFDMALRNLLLLVFFSTIGLSAKFRLLIAGGRALVILVVIAGVFLVIQDATGVSLALLFGAHPGYGLLGGSVSLAGGHGTAIAWGAEAERAGLAGAAEVGIAFATFGLIAGGLVGGPIAGRLIARYNLQGPTGEGASTAEPASATSGDPIGLSDRLGTILLAAICVELGSLVNRLLFAEGVVLPGFLTSLLVGVLLTNLADLLRVRISRAAVDAWASSA
jgi:ESS family glutamate:Na+ symporter